MIEKIMGLHADICTLHLAINSYLYTSAERSHHGPILDVWDVDGRGEEGERWHNEGINVTYDRE